jgi:hypothetical protein
VVSAVGVAAHGIGMEGVGQGVCWNESGGSKCGRTRGYGGWGMGIAEGE